MNGAIENINIRNALVRKLYSDLMHVPRNVKYVGDFTPFTSNEIPLIIPPDTNPEFYDAWLIEGVTINYLLSIWDEYVETFVRPMGQHIEVSDWLNLRLKRPQSQYWLIPYYLTKEEGALALLAIIANKARVLIHPDNATIEVGVGEKLIKVGVSPDGEVFKSTSKLRFDRLPLPPSWFQFLQGSKQVTIDNFRMMQNRKLFTIFNKKIPEHMRDKALLNLKLIDVFVPPEHPELQEIYKEYRCILTQTLEEEDDEPIEGLPRAALRLVAYVRFHWDSISNPLPILYDAYVRTTVMTESRFIAKFRGEHLLCAPLDTYVVPSLRLRWLHIITTKQENLFYDQTTRPPFSDSSNAKADELFRKHFGLEPSTVLRSGRRHPVNS